MTIPPAPEGVLSLVKCNCIKSKCSNNQCSCRKSSLNCTELCGRSADEENCENLTIDVENEDVDNESVHDNEF